MDRAYQLEEMLEDLAEEIEPHLPVIPEFLSRLNDIDKPLSVFSTTSFLPKIESIRIGVFEVAKKEEYYSANILYRSIIEHFVKGQYLWMKTLDNEDDEVGIDYWVFGQDNERIAYARSLQHAYELVGIVPRQSPIETLKEMGVVSKEKSSNLIRRKSEQFGYRNMTVYLAQNLKEKNTGTAHILSGVFPRYAELSSCVHGGPESVGTYEKGPNSVKEIVDMSTFMSLSTRYCSFLLMYQYEKEMASLCNVTRKYLQRFFESDATDAQEASETDFTYNNPMEPDA